MGEVWTRAGRAHLNLLHGKLHAIGAMQVTLSCWVHAPIACTASASSRHTPTAWRGPCAIYRPSCGTFMPEVASTSPRCGVQAQRRGCERSRRGSGLSAACTVLHEACHGTAAPVQRTRQTEVRMVRVMMPGIVWAGVCADGFHDVSSCLPCHCVCDPFRSLRPLQSHTWDWMDAYT